LSLLKQDACAELLPLCAKEGIATMPYQVLQSGLLTGKYAGGTVPKDSRAGEKPEWLKVDAGTLATLENLGAGAKRHGRTLRQHALLWALDQRSVVSLIVGVKSIEQLETLWEAVQL
jgi:aryl-alcohol dehydrogenase-like predicted oxidoreductase